MDINNARAIVRDYISDWTEEKLCQVLAFCQDGKMQFCDSCSCLLGVASSDVLHTSADKHGLPGHDSAYFKDILYNTSHYVKALQTGIGSLAEKAYQCIADLTEPDETRSAVRDREFIAIIESVLAERSAALQMR